MFKLKSKLIIAVMVMFGIAAFMSCEKEVTTNTNKAVPTTSFGQDKLLTLDEFIASVETDDERNFFKEHEIVDNRKVANKAIKYKVQLKPATSKPKVRFRWGDGCSRPIGICIIIPLGANEANAEVVTVDGKYVIIPKTDDNGITDDGYLPIFEDLYVDETTTIKAGIYTAYYDEQQGKFTAVALDIK